LDPLNIGGAFLELTQKMIENPAKLWEAQVAQHPAIGWFPLAPGEIYRPGYRVSDNYVRQVNVTNTVINNTGIAVIRITQNRAGEVLPIARIATPNVRGTRNDARKTVNRRNTSTREGKEDPCASCNTGAEIM
jgi:hypothetical protein